MKLVRPPRRHGRRGLLFVAGGLGFFLVAAFAVAGPTWFSGSAPLGGWVGRDLQGHSLIHDLSLGARRTLTLAGVATCLGLLIGLPLGAWSGLKAGGLADRAVNVATQLHALPAVFVYAILVRWQGPPAFGTLCGLVTTIQVLENARSLRSQLRTRAREGYVLAAYGLGANPAFVVRRHLLPQLGPTALERLAVGLATATFLDGALGFLGLAPEAPTRSWGSLMAQAAGTESATRVLWMSSALVAWTVASALLLASALRRPESETLPAIDPELSATGEPLRSADVSSGPEPR